MGELSARKLSVISVDPDAKSKKLDETIEKLSAIRKEQEKAEKVPLPSISAKKVDLTDEKSFEVEPSEAPEQENKIAPTQDGSSLKSSLRVTSTVSKTLKEQSQDEKAPASVFETKAVKTKMPVESVAPVLSKTPVLDEMFDGDADNESVLMLSPKNSVPMGRSLKYKLVTGFGALATLSWLGLSASYVTGNMGFAELFSQQPHILGGFLAGVLAPIALLWMILSHFQRGADIHMYSDALRGELQAMIFPSEERKQIIHKDIEALCMQAAELSASSKTVLGSIHRARIGLRNEIRDFSGLSKKTEFHIDRLADSLSERSQRLIDLTNDIESRTTSLDAKTLSGAKAWDDAAISILSRASEIEEAMKKGAQQIVHAADEADQTTGNINEKLESSFKVLQSSVESVKAMTGGTVEAITQAAKTIEDNRDSLGDGAKLLADKAAEITDTLNGSVGAMQDSVDALVGKSEGIDSRLNERVESLGNVLGDLDGKIEQIEAKGAEASNKLSEAMVSAISGADNIASSVRRAIETLSRSTSEAKTQAEELLEKTEQKVAGLSEVGAQTAQNVTNVLSLIDTSREKIEESSNLVNVQVEKLSAAVSVQSAAIDKAQESLNDRVDAIQLSMNEPLEIIGRAVDKASEKHAAIEETLSKRIDDLNVASDKALDNTNIIRDSLRTQAQEISTLAGQLAGHSKSVQSMVSGQSDLLSQNVTQAIEKIESVGQSLATQSENLISISQNAEEEITSLKDAITDKCKSVNVDTVKVVEDLCMLDDVMGEKVKTLVSQSGEASRSVENMTSSLVSSADMIQPIYSEAIDKIEATRARFDKMSSGFEENTTSNLDKLKSMGILFDERLQLLTSSAQDASHILDQSSEVLSSKVTNIETATKAAGDRLRDMDSLFKKQASDIHLTTDQALLKIESIQKALNDQFLDLSSSVGESVAQIENVGAQYTKRAEQIKQTSEEVVDRFDVAGQAADTQAEKLKLLAKESSENMREIVRDVQDEAKELLESSSKTFMEMKKTGDGFAMRAKEVEAQMKQSLKTTHEYGEQLERQSDKMAENSHASADQISDAIAKLAGKMLEVNKAADMVSGKIEGSRNKLTAETEHLADVSIKAARVVEESAQHYVRQSNSLFKATQDAVAQADKIRESDSRVQREGFMNSAKFVLESLHSLSVDLTRMMEGDIKEKVWKIYQKGDVAAFTRHLLEMKDQLPMDKMQAKYSDDNEFRTYMNRFMRQFEEVYEQALDNDHGDILVNIFSSSDIGALYGILCGISGRKSVVQKLSSQAA